MEHRIWDDERRQVKNTYKFNKAPLNLKSEILEVARYKFVVDAIFFLYKSLFCRLFVKGASYSD
jgi:hypothetical protein